MTMRGKKFTLLLLSALLFSTFPGLGQPNLSAYEDGVYRATIRSVRFHVNGLALTLPIARLGLPDALSLAFDDLNGQGTGYYYTVIHCDRYWQPTTGISRFEYLQGYQEGEIRDYDISSGTYQHYLHYRLTLPNNEVKWTRSGNYLLVIYEAGSQDDPILTRRFMVVDETISVSPKVNRPVVVSKQDTYQEVDFTLNAEALRSFDPFNDISCTILQNGRWDNCLRDIRPRFINGHNLDFNYPDKIVFPAGKEFRQLDISSMKYRSENVLMIERFPEGYDITLFDEEPRSGQAYLFRFDLNGKFVPFNSDFIRKRIPPDSLSSTLNLVQRYNYREQALGTEYAEVNFTLNLPENFPQPVYIVGGLSDWRLLPENRLQYDERAGAFTARLYLKQGYYDYGYAVPDDHGNPDFSSLEGDWYATENEYTILVYFRPRGGEYDQLVGARSFTNYP